MGVGNGGNEFEKRGVGCTITQPCSRFKKIRWSALQAVKALGMARAGWIPDYHRTRRPHVDLAPLVAQGLLLRARVEGWDDPVYIHPEHAGLAGQAAEGRLNPTLSTILSPFDPVVWDRRRALELFGFDYRLECYTPAPKRRYGYFTLPVLRRGMLVGRIDAKAHRKTGVFEVKAAFFEPGVRPREALLRDVAQAVQRCARWHACPNIELGRTEPAGLEGSLATALATPADAA
jgi:uncharacterized protein YcaQ